jgi:hypothetical protein
VGIIPRRRHEADSDCATGETTMPEVPTYLTGVGDLPTGVHPLRVGDRVHLRSRSGTVETEAWSECGHRLGRLPPAERKMLIGLGLCLPLVARIAALVPRPGTPHAGRVLLQLDAT